MILGELGVSNTKPNMLQGGAPWLAKLAHKSNNNGL